MLLLLTITVVLILIVIVKFISPILIRYSQLQKDYQNITLLPLSPIPYIGNAHQFNKPPHIATELLIRLAKECQDQNKGAFCIWFGLWPKVVLCSGKGLEVFHNFMFIFTNLIFSHNYSRLLVNNWSSLPIMNFLHLGLKLVYLLGKVQHSNSNNLFVFDSNHEKWRSRRRLITPSFHDTQLLHNYMNIFNEQASILARRLDEYTKQPNQTYDLYPYISACTLDIIAGLLNCLLKNVSDFIV
jgi:hypothetical protein